MKSMNCQFGGYRPMSRDWTSDNVRAIFGPRAESGLFRRALREFWSYRYMGGQHQAHHVSISRLTLLARKAEAGPVQKTVYM